MSELSNESVFINGKPLVNDRSEVCTSHTTMADTLQVSPDYILAAINLVSEELKASFGIRKIGDQYLLPTRARSLLRTNYLDKVTNEDIVKVQEELRDAAQSSAPQVLTELSAPTQGHPNDNTNTNPEESYGFQSPDR